MTLARLLASTLLIAFLSASCSADRDDSEQDYGKDSAVGPQLADEHDSRQYSDKDSAARAHLVLEDNFEQYYGKFYSVVRRQLVDSGYELVRIEHDEPPFTCSGDEPCENFPELMSCAGTGVSPCDFAFRNKKDGRCIVVATYGETRPRVHGIFPASELVDPEEIGMNCK